MVNELFWCRNQRSRISCSLVHCPILYVMFTSKSNYKLHIYITNCARFTSCSTVIINIKSLMLMMPPWSLWCGTHAFTFSLSLYTRLSHPKSNRRTGECITTTGKAANIDQPYLPLNDQWVAFIHKIRFHQIMWLQESNNMAVCRSGWVWVVNYCLLLQIVLTLIMS